MYHPLALQAALPLLYNSCIIYEADIPLGVKAHTKAQHLDACTWVHARLMNNSGSNNVKGDLWSNRILLDSASCYSTPTSQTSVSPIYPPTTWASVTSLPSANLQNMPFNKIIVHSIRVRPVGRLTMQAYLSTRDNERLRIKATAASSQRATWVAL